MNLKCLLKQEFINKKIDIEEKLIPRGFELCGNVAVIDFSSFAHKKLLMQNNAELIKKAISEYLQKINKNINTILLKKNKLEGEFRLGDYEIIFGKNTECIYRENNCEFAFDIEKMYFSTKLGSERQILANSINNGEVILSAFAGVCPYPIVIAKQKDVKIDAIENNTYCKKYALANIKKNKVEDRVDFYCQDIVDFVKHCNKKYNRILMTAPKINHNFLDLLIQCLDLNKKKTGIINYYCFCKIDKNIDETKIILENLEQKFIEKNLVCSFKNIRKCGNFAPYQYRTHIEIDLKKKFV
ncbi:MAG: hypothetical protein B6U87_00065 [Candidatus Aenigmarchaeota archaeon ex4484_52]|nr:MAG: hypothetical protein B6U87_00065 [Candidatus Aenigmarchaeota archaeon ex4484_52]